MANRVPVDWEARSRALYEESIATLDLRTRSRLTEARHAALDAARRPRAAVGRMLPRWSWLVAGVAAALLMAVVLRIAMPSGGAAAGTDGSAARAEDAGLVASADPADDPVRMMSEDADFYTWAAGVAASADAGRTE